LIEENKRLKLELKCEKFYNTILKQLIRHYTAIPIDKIFKETEEGLHIYDFEKGNMPIIVHSALKNGKGKKKIYNVNGDENDKKDVFRTVKNQIPLKEEEEKKEIVEKSSLSEDKFTIITEQLSLLIQSLQNEKQYNKVLINIRNRISNMLEYLPLYDYITKLTENIEKVKSILTKRIGEKKAFASIGNALFGLDQRLLSFPHYHMSQIDSEEVERLKKSLELIPHSKEYIPYNKEFVFSHLKSYALAIFPVFNLINDIVFNKYGFYNVIYLPIAKSLEEDPYSYYILVLNEKEIRKWKMDCRLEDLCRELSEELRMYCVVLFRKIYFDIFNDNHYREDFKSKFNILSEDCVQLLQNIKVLSMQKLFRTKMKTLVREKANYIPTDHDKFNLTGDDIIQKQRLSIEKDTDEELLNITRMLFDNVNSKLNIFI